MHMCSYVTLAQSLVCVSSFHPWSSTCALVLWVSSSSCLSLYFFLQSYFHLFLIPVVPDENSMEDPLCDSSFGSMVSLDYVTPDTCSAVALETGICSWFLVFSLSFSFAFLSLSLPFSTAFAVIVPLAVLIIFVVLSQYFAKFFLCHGPSCLFLLSCLHCPDFHRYWSMTIILPGNSSMQLEEFCDLLDSSQVRSDWCWWSWQHSVTEHFTCHLLEQFWFSHFNSLFLYPSVVPKSNDVPVRRSIPPCSICASSQCHASELLLFSPNPEPRSCTPWPHHHVQCFVRLSAIRDRFSELHRWIRCLVQPFLSCVVEETKPVTKDPLEVPPFSSVEKSEGLPNSLGSTLVDRLPACVGTVDVTNVTSKRFSDAWAHNLVK